MTEPITQSQINLRARYFYLSCVLLLAIRFAGSTLFSQLSQPVLIDPGIDNTYWLFHWLGIPYTATHSIFGSAILDILIFVLPLVASLVPGRRIYAFVFSILLLTYQITYSTYAMHHFHSLIGMLILSVPFWFGPGLRFAYLWEAARYYFFFIFASASLWKLSTGGLWHTDQMRSILMAQHAQYSFDYPSSILTQLHSYLIAHSGIATAVLLTGFVIQLSFFGGFFTKKFDRIYLALFILFFAINYLLMHIVSLELFVFILPLLDWDSIENKQLIKDAKAAA